MENEIAGAVERLNEKGRWSIKGRTSSFAATMCPTAKRARDWRGANPAGVSRPGAKRRGRSAEPRKARFPV
jgi:hypothetical protein